MGCECQARKALHALRGLVKIQALVRGHLIRKQTSATLRGMQALMAIQVRARIRRIQTAEEANLLRKHSPRHQEIAWNKVLLREFKVSLCTILLTYTVFFSEDRHIMNETFIYNFDMKKSCQDMVQSVIRPLSLQDSKDTSLREMLKVMESRSGPLDSPDTENGAMSFYSEHLTDSKRRYQYKDNALIRETRSSGNNLSICQRHSVSWEPNYLTKTESSRAKARSLSEPKQRPKRGTRRRNKSIESLKELIIPLDGRRQSLSSSSSRYINHGSMDHWVMNHHESMMDRRSDTFNSSMAICDSYY